MARARIQWERDPRRMVEAVARARATYCVAGGAWTTLNRPPRVTAADDPRHEGRLEAIKLDGTMARVRWTDTGWLSYLPLGDLAGGIPR